MKRSNLSPAVQARLVRLPPPHEAHYGVVPAPPPEEAVPLKTARAAHDTALQALGTAEAWAAATDAPFPFTRILTRQEAVSSSSIEGTHSTLDELLTLEETGDNEGSSAARQVHDYAVTLERLIPQARRDGPALFTLPLIQDLHREVMRDDPDYRDIPGALRDRVVWIGGSRIEHSLWNPPPPDRVPGCLADTLDYLRCNGMQAVHQGLLTRMAVGHAHFEAVHPFRDGNGRVGRLLLPLMMAADGQAPLYLSPFIESRKDRYYHCLQAAQQRLEWEAMVEFLADAVTATANELSVTRQALETLGHRWRQRRKFRKGSGSLHALDVLPYYPILTVHRLAGLLGLSFVQASGAVRQLVDAGILTERTGYRRNRIFAAPEVLRILNRPFESEPELPDA